MRTYRVNHVTIVVRDLERSARFFEELFGAARIATPNFGQPVLFLQLGEQQLHLYQSDQPAPAYHHFALEVDDFDGVYAQAKARGILDDPFGATLRQHPAGWIQTWMRDPDGNLVEVDWPDASTLAPATLEDIEQFEATLPQEGEQRGASLYTPVRTPQAHRQ
jgi:YD repeat-containing protein